MFFHEQSWTLLGHQAKATTSSIPGRLGKVKITGFQRSVGIVRGLMLVLLHGMRCRYSSRCCQDKCTLFTKSREPC